MECVEVSSSTASPGAGATGEDGGSLPSVVFYAGPGDGDPFEVNSRTPIPFENEVFVGETLFLHRPHPDSRNWPYAAHFDATSRSWEMRCQGVFKTDPGEVFFGAELPEDLNTSQKRLLALKWMAKAVGRLANIKGVTCHYSFDMQYLPNGSEVRPHYVAPILCAQAVVVTPKGETPPPLISSFPETPFAEKLQININTDDTFTFCFWMKHLDLARWEVCNLPFRLNGSLEAFVGRRPIHMIAYSIRRPECDGNVHAECNKRSMVRFVCSPPESSSSRAGLRHTLSRSLSNIFDRQHPMPSVRLLQGTQAQDIKVNSLTPIPFETDIFTGHVVFLQRPSPEPRNDSWPYAQHFKPTQRRWEMRCQGKFRKIPAGEVFFGAEMRQNSRLTLATRTVANWVLKIAKFLAAQKGVWFDHNFETVVLEDGSTVLPHYVSPMFAAEALYATPPGQTPPILTDTIINNPLSEKQCIKPNLEDTFTIALWNKQLDFSRWQICGMPFGWTSSFTPFVGEQPIHLVAYASKQADVSADSLHADTNKDYILRLEVSPPPTRSDWRCHQGLNTGVVLGQGLASFHEKAERMAPRTLAKAINVGDGQDDWRRRRFWCIPRCFAWCR